VGLPSSQIHESVFPHLTSTGSQIAFGPFGHKSLMGAFVRFEADAPLVAAIGLDCGAKMFRWCRGFWFAQAYQ
jgi:hypothetical protein